MSSRLVCLSILCGLLVSACGEGSANEPPPTPPSPPVPTVAQTVTALEASGTLPQLDRSSTLGGADTNNNGVRDDIDSYIQRQPRTVEQKAALTQFAKSSQMMILLDPANRQAIDSTNLASARAVDCVFARFSGTNAAASAASAAAAAQTIEELTANTRPRLLALMAAAKASSGTVLPSPRGDTCE